MRAAVTLLAALVVVASAYFAVTGYVLYRVTAELLRVGGLEAMIAEAQEPPQDPRDLGWRGDPQAAFGMDFAEVLLQGEAGPLPAWIVPPDPAGPMAAIYVHGIAGAREDGYRHLPLLREGGVPPSSTVGCRFFVDWRLAAQVIQGVRAVPRSFRRESCSYTLYG